jgi:multiple sugar transport system substrate-binding protein
MSERLDPNVLSPLKRPMSRRAVLRFGLIAAALPLAAACGQAPAPTATTAPAKPAAPPAAPAAASPVSSPAASPAAAASPVASGAAIPPTPSFNKARIDGKLSVIIDADFYPEHNAFVEQKIREFCDKMGYPLDFSTVASFVGTANISQKLTAAVQANDSPDVLTHTEKPSALKFLEVLEDVDDVQKAIINQWGELFPAYKKTSFFDGKYWAVNHFSRAGGFWAREGAFKDVGLDIRKDLDDFDKVREAALKASKPEKESWGWGMTVNRSGDGDGLVRDMVLFMGGQLTDESGQLVVLNKEPFRQYAITALDRLKEIYTDPKYASMVPPGVLSWTDTSNNEAYLAGKIFYTSNAGTMFAKAVVDKNPVADDTYLIPSPKGTGPGGRRLLSASQSKRWFVIKGARNREAAGQLIQYMHSPDVMAEMFRISQGYVYPAYQNGWDLPALKESKAATHVTDVWRQYLADPSGYYGEASWPGPPTPWAGSLESSNFFTDMMGEVLGGTATADAVANAHARAVRVFKEFGAKGE